MSSVTTPSMWTRSGLAALVLLIASPALAQQPAERDRAAAGAAGDPATASEPGSEHHTGGPSDEDAEEQDPSKHFNFIGQTPGHLFDYLGKDEFGGPFGDGKMVDPETHKVIHEEEPASPPFVFMVFNFAILIGLIVWQVWPLAQKTAAERHDLIKTAIEEAARLRQQAADKLAEYETKLEAADSEIKALIEGLRADAEADKIRIRKAAEAQAQQIKRDAELRIAAEIELARAQLTREVTVAATAATEKLLRDKITSADQQNLVGAFIADVQQAGSIGRSAAGPARTGDAR
jgi:F-type H+-transporting ATPase subunit b